MDAFNGSTFFPSPLWAASTLGVPTSPTSTSARFPGRSRAVSLHHTSRRARSAGAALAYGARLAYLASLEEDAAEKKENAEPEEAAVQTPPAAEDSVARTPADPRSASTRSRPVSKNSPSPISNGGRTNGDGTECASRSPSVLGDASSTKEKESEKEEALCLDDAAREPRGSAATSSFGSPRDSPLPFGAAYASSPLPAATTRRANRGSNHELTREPIASDAAGDAAPRASSPFPGSASADPGGGARAGVSSEVSDADKELVERYDAMQTDFFLETRGFAMDKVDETRRWFHFEEPPGVGVWPLPYAQLGLPRDCARLVVLSLVDAPAVAAAGAACAREMVKLLGPCGAACFNVSRNAYHVSVFFLSTPTEPVADPLFVPSPETARTAPAATDRTRTRACANANAVNVSLASAPLKRIGERFQPAHDAEAREAELAARESFSDGRGDSAANAALDDASRAACVLEVDRVAMAVSGALLLLFRDPNGDLRRLRARLRDRFPNAPEKQTTIAHCTLLRAFPRTGDTLTAASSGRALADAKALCARWTARVRGMRVRVDRAWLVREERFASIDGARRAFTFGH